MQQQQAAAERLQGQEGAAAAAAAAERPHQTTAGHWSLFLQPLHRKGRKTRQLLVPHLLPQAAPHLHSASHLLCWSRGPAGGGPLSHHPTAGWTPWHSNSSRQCTLQFMAWHRHKHPSACFTNDCKHGTVLACHERNIVSGLSEAKACDFTPLACWLLLEQSPQTSPETHLCLSLETQTPSRKPALCSRQHTIMRTSSTSSAVHLVLFITRRKLAAQLRESRQRDTCR
jgi:hypothetical protein